MAVAGGAGGGAAGERGFKVSRGLRRTPEEFAKGSVAGSINIPIKLSDGSGGYVPNPDFDEQVCAWAPAPHPGPLTLLSNVSSRMHA